MEAQNAIRAIIGVTLESDDPDLMLRFRDGSVDLGSTTIKWDDLATMALENDQLWEEADDGSFRLVRGLLAPTANDADAVIKDTFSRLVARIIVLIAQEGLSGVNFPASYLDFGSLSTDLLPQLNAEYGPSLVSIRQNLLELDKQLTDARKVFDAVQDAGEGASGFLDEIEQYGNQSLFQLSDLIETALEDKLVAQLKLWEGVGRLDELNTEAGRLEFSAFIEATLRQEILASDFFQGVQMSLRQRIYDLNASIRTQIDSVFAMAEQAVKQQIADLVPDLDLGIESDFLSPFDNICGYGNVDGYLSIVGNRADLLRLDALLEMKAPSRCALTALFRSRRCILRVLAVVNTEARTQQRSPSVRLMYRSTGQTAKTCA